MSKHTPGPWKRAGRWGNIHSAISDPTGGQIIASVWTHKQKALGRRAKGPDDYEETEEGMANYRLMLAAPELLEAAEAVLSNAIDTEAFGPDDVDPDDWDGPLDEDGAPWFWDFWNLREAIAKATGGEA